MKRTAPLKVNYFLGSMLLAIVSVLLSCLVGAVIFLPTVGCLFAFCILLYAYFVYPLIVYVLQDRRAPHEATTASMPRLSVVIPAHNEQDLIVAKVANCIGQTYPAELMDIIVVDDASSDATVAKLQEANFPQLTLVRRSERGGKSSAILDGVKAAKGDLLLLTDANVFADNMAFELLVTRLSSGVYKCVSGNVLLTSPTNRSLAAESTYQSFEGSLLRNESRLYSSVCVDGGMYVILREFLEAPPINTILDDFAISVAVINRGGRIGFEPDAIARESSSITIQDEFNRRVRLAEGSIQTMRRGVFPHPQKAVAFWQFLSHKLLRWITPAIFFLALVGLFVLCFEYFAARLIFGLVTMAMGVAAIGLVFPQLRQIKLIGIASYVLLVQSAIVLGSLRGLLSESSSAWQHAQRHLG